MAIYRALEAFAYNDENGNPMPVTPGSLVDGDSAAYKGRANFFEPVEDSVIRAALATETATSAPGERRSRRAPAKRAASKVEDNTKDDDA
ncbi:hypothetical protein EUA02_29930 [Mycobacterium paragordonae]|uniref:hypothetical protein n=1 Tax=Mycobacterium paragordonae TaxID=1389713 RepID=UPI00105C506F|nr:hypothetical protein [Mycobacterium paragordonae]TDK85479.1 hypothetical protein EUA02_29930 [Mycobacterium paragordonae]TDK98949.1 hypothetical protein EUA05_31055 [Mycobacterium paragordonae]